ncbi:MAG: hypothetical protein WBQ18_08725 [Solirubrobacteraceae bacterium]
MALLPAAALAVHQLRYFLAFGGDAAAQLKSTGHSYLHSVVPWIVLLAALAAGGFLRSLGRALGGRVSRSGQTISFTGLWLACAASLVAIFAGQEFLEGLFATGHPAGLAGIFGYGGWWAIPVSLCIGLVLAACLYSARWVIAEVIRRYGARPPRRRRRVAPSRRPLLVLGPTPAPVADGWSDRGPPA